MLALIHKFKALSLIVAFVAFTLPQTSIAGEPISICKSEKKPCAIPPYQLSYQCVEKGSSECSPKGQYNK